ncbi:helix-turn-helix domain-containing protein [Metabacillus sp. 84]|uniref:helix-turn-helix domain-containing protein n=1 Tax=unclassified Metabacillus TaxID=2675274 RepID=UPI003CE9FA0A
MLGSPCSSYGAFIREKRLELGLTEEEFAEKLNFTKPYIERIERGEVYPSETLVAMLSSELGIPFKELNHVIWCDPPNLVCS